MKARTYILEKLTALMAGHGLGLPPKTTVEPPKNEQHGDIATNVAMVMPREKGENPRALAESIKAELALVCPELERIDIAGPGFINFTFTDTFWQSVALDALTQGRDFGRVNVGQGRRVQVEYVSANPTGPLHIGHGRGAAIGDSLTRVLRFTGHEVETEYYLNDAGRQMRLLGLAVWVRYQQACGRQVEFPEDCYRGDYIKDISARLRAEHGEALLDLPEAEAIDLCYERGMRDILDGIRADLAAFRVEHQHWFSEKSLVDAGQVEATLDRLLREGLAYEKDGALWFRSTDYGDDKNRVLRKSNGLLTYFASDIAYHDNKIARGFDLMVDIWGADHHGYVPRMKAAMEALGRDRESLQVILVQLVNLIQGGEQVAMSTRAGKFETLADVCAEVGADAARFIFLSRKSDSHLDFDLDAVKRQSMDNPVYYVQYAHARIRSLLRKAEEQNVELPEPSAARMECLDTAEDKALLKSLDGFADAVELAARTLSPHHISFYLMDLAGLLHRYYTVHHILSVDDGDLLQARLLLFSAVAEVIGRGLDLLGVTAPDRM